MRPTKTEICAHCGAVFDWTTASKHKLHKRSGKPRCLHKRPDRSAHAELVGRAARWLSGNRRCHVVFAEPTIAVSHQVDAIGWRGAASHVVECKVSRCDLLRELDKCHVRADRTLGHYRWLCVPVTLIGRGRGVDLLDLVVKRLPGWGLIIAGARRIQLVLEAEYKALTQGAMDDERYLLVMAVRRHQLGVRWDGATKRFEPMAEHRAQATLTTSDDESHGAESASGSVAASSEVSSSQSAS